MAMPKTINTAKKKKKTGANFDLTTNLLIEEY